MKTGFSLALSLDKPAHFLARHRSVSADSHQDASCQTRDVDYSRGFADVRFQDLENVPQRFVVVVVTRSRLGKNFAD